MGTSELTEKSAMATIGPMNASGQGSWPRVAALMGCKPGMAIFRRFRTLNALRLLEMQSHLVQQEQNYEYLCSLDAKVDCPTSRSYSTNWETLDESSGSSGTLQKDAWREVKDGLESYSNLRKPALMKGNILTSLQTTR